MRIPNVVGVSSAVEVPGVVVAVVLILVSVAVLLTAVWLFSRFMTVEKGRTPLVILFAVLVAGLIIRFVPAFTVTGFRDDINRYSAIASMFKNGNFNYYGTDAYGQVNPLSFYIIGIFGAIPNAMGLSTDSLLAAFFIKLPFIFADIATAFILYRIAYRYSNQYVGLVAAGLYAVCPVFFVASGFWGSAITLMLPLLLLSLYLLVQKKHLFAILCYALALLTVPDAAYFYPAYLIYYGYQIFRSIRLNLKEKKSFAEAFNDPELGLCYRIPIYFIGAFLLKYLISMPFALASASGNPFKLIGQVFIKPLTAQEYFSENGISIYNIFNRNGATLGSFPITVFVILFGVLITAIGCVAYFSKKNRAVIVLYAAFVPYTLCSYCFGFSTMSYLPAVVLMLMAFLLIKDRRLLQIMLVTAFCFVTAGLTVMAGASYLNATEAVLTGPAVYLMDKGFALAAMIITSILSIAGHFYALLIFLDISMSNNRKLLTGYPEIGYFKGIGRLFKESRKE